MANVREHCSWVHGDRAAATAKAIDLVRVMVEKVKRNRASTPIPVPVSPRAVVIGGGIAGIQAALDIADRRTRRSCWSRKSPSIGGHMARLSETFPTLDCSQCILTPRMVEAASHPNITLMTYSEVESVGGFVGNFEVTVRRKARYVDLAKCTGCGECWSKCPSKNIPSEFDAGLSQPDRDLPRLPAGRAQQAGDRRAALPDAHEGHAAASAPRSARAGPSTSRTPIELVKVKVGAIVLATGFELWDHSAYGEYGAGRIADVIDGFAFERLASASGPTGGEIRRPSDGTEPKTVVFVQCCGSRDEKAGREYCSKICCMYTAKHAMLYAHKVHGGRAVVFYMDIRAAGKGYDEFVRRAIEKDGAEYIRGRVSKIYRRADGKIIVRGADTLAGTPVDRRGGHGGAGRRRGAPARTRRSWPRCSAWLRRRRLLQRGAPEAPPGGDRHRRRLPGRRLPGAEGHPGVGRAGLRRRRQGARPVRPAETRARAGRRRVNRITCAHCRACINACPYKAIEDFNILDRSGKVLRTVANVNEGLCQGCGTCVSVCRSKSMDLDGFTDEQVYLQIATLEPLESVVSPEFVLNARRLPPIIG